jgi:tryptophan 2,3-dioxygenase
MAQPAPWNGDPACGHEVADAYQTHYCTYIRVPRLLGLQAPARPNELLLITAYQWYELWFKVLLADLRAALSSGDAAAPATYEPVKLLRRGSELFKLFDQHADLAETICQRELNLRQPLRDVGAEPPSAQFALLARLAPQVANLSGAGAPGLAEAAADYGARFERWAAQYRRFASATLTCADDAPSFVEWLRLPTLLNLQQGVKSAWSPASQSPAGHWRPEHISPDENLFIIVHQCFEVYFQVILDQVDRALAVLQAGDVGAAAALIRRAVLVQRLLVPQIQMPATMLPLDFLRFRHQTRARDDGQEEWTGLTPASGTESYQFREIEIVCGLRGDPVFQKFLEGLDTLPVKLLTPRQRQRLSEPTLPEVFMELVRARGLTDLKDLFTLADIPNPNQDLAELADWLVEFDQFFYFWRVGHASMVEKMIGGRSGTGFLGPEYLAETAGIRIQQRNRVFEDRQVRPRFFEALWEVRQKLRA